MPAQHYHQSRDSFRSNCVPFRHPARLRHQSPMTFFCTQGQPTGNPWIPVISDDLVQISPHYRITSTREFIYSIAHHRSEVNVISRWLTRGVEWRHEVLLLWKDKPVDNNRTNGLPTSVKRYLLNDCNAICVFCNMVYVIRWSKQSPNGGWWWPGTYITVTP